LVACGGVLDEEKGVEQKVVLVGGLALLDDYGKGVRRMKGHRGAPRRRWCEASDVATR